MIKNRFLCKTNEQGITTIFAVVVMLLLFTASCNGDNKEVVVVAFDPETTYTLRTTDYTTQFSDSGITRYRAIAKEFLKFDKAKEPFSYFPEGIYVEKFDTLFNIEASLKADTAYNYEKKGLWKLIGNVRVENLEGKKFETSLLFWDQKEEKVYSDKYIRIQEDDKIITGIGFESNQNMTQYKIFNSQGVFPVSESVTTDSTQNIVPVDSMPIAVMLLLFTASCNGDNKEVVVVAFDPETTYTLRTTDYTTQFSDSGITRYRAIAKEFLKFDKAKEPFSYFPEGIYVEKFDTLFNIEASLKADTAYNYEKKGLWKLIGNVRVENLEGKKFETSLLFWDQKEEKVYSDKYIRIQEDDKIITGIGFESNQNMTQYKIFNSQGVFPVSESVTTDSTQNIVPVDSMPIAANPAMETVPQKQPAQKEKVVPRKLVPAEMDKTK